MSQYANNSQICWECENCSPLLCCWIDKGKPVEGWQAVKREIVTYHRIKGGGFTKMITYKIKYCPNFRLEKLEVKENE